MANPFITYLEDISPLSEEAKEAIIATCHEKTYSKNHLLVSDFAQCDKFFFIVSGLLRVYYSKNDKEITDWFGCENSLIGPLIGGQKLQNAIHSIDLLEDSTIIQVSLWDLELLCANYHDIERLGRMIAIQTAAKLQYKIESMLFMTAKQRYNEFMSQHASVLQRAPLGHIASYLGMNQVTLSRARVLKK